MAQIWMLLVICGTLSAASVEGSIEVSCREVRRTGQNVSVTCTIDYLEIPSSEKNCGFRFFFINEDKYGCCQNVCKEGVYKCNTYVKEIHTYILNPQPDIYAVSLRTDCGSATTNINLTGHTPDATPQPPTSTNVLGSIGIQEGDTRIAAAGVFITLGVVVLVALTLIYKRRQNGHCPRMSSSTEIDLDKANQCQPVMQSSWL
ncbi:uncharacterized protein LOC134077022 [Sardina pilchardus]|uniref:uncharacterized protein LOC134077022 n=1 Tax=Sardina pilchardus TaxID=27697 RepID=UPI002E1663F1